MTKDINKIIKIFLTLKYFIEKLNNNSPHPPFPIFKSVSS